MEIDVGPVAPVIVMVQMALPPCCRVNPPPQDDETLSPAVTVSAIVVVEVNVPEVPVMGLPHPEIVMPPDEARWVIVTAPLNGLTSVTVIVTVALAP